MAVVVLIALLFTAAGLSVQNLTGANLKKDAWVMASNIGAVYARSVTRNAYYRMVFDLDEGTYTTEVADTRFFIGAGKEEDDTPLFAKKDKDKRKAGKVQFLEEAEGPAMHQATAQEVTDGLLGNIKVSRGVKIEGVMTTHQRDIKDKGKAFVYFFPSGFVEKAMVYLTDGDRYYTLTTQPLTGRVRVAAGKLDVPSSFDRQEEYGGHF